MNHAMNSIKLIYLKDFVVINGYVNTIHYFSDFSKAALDEHTILFYQKSKVQSHCSLINNNQKNEIQWNNSFYPIFHYKSDKYEILTPNYENLLKLNLPLSLNDKGIREFILFNTCLQDHTFHNEVYRLTGIEKIVFENSKLNFHFKIRDIPQVGLKERFTEKIESLIAAFKEYNHGVFLSGGGESRINAAITHAYNFRKDFITWGHPQDKEYLIASQIAKKLNTKIINVRPDSSNLPYNELLEKTGFLVNMQYAYRYAAVKQLFEQFDYDVIWTGWGDVNGYPTMYQPSELFSDYYLGLYEGENRYPAGWNKDWLHDFAIRDSYIREHIKDNPSKKTFFQLKQSLFAPHIFGQVLSIENTLGVVFAPWFHPDIYAAIQYEEKLNEKLINHKLHRTLWKNELYFQLVKRYCSELNHIKNSKGYYPWWVRKRYGVAGLLLAAVFKLLNSKKSYPFDAVEDKFFMKEELERIVEEGGDIFDKKDISNIIRNIDDWKGSDILEYFKIIQVHWFLKR